jgi:hypothetical protein
VLFAALNGAIALKFLFVEEVGVDNEAGRRQRPHDKNEEHEQILIPSQYSYLLQHREVDSRVCNRRILIKSLILHDSRS